MNITAPNGRGGDFYLPYTVGMGRGPHPAMYLVMALIRDGMKPIEAANLVGVDVTTLYKSRLYKEWRNAQISRS